MILLLQTLPRFRHESDSANFAAGIVAKMALAAKRRAHLRADRQDSEADLDLIVASRPTPSEKIAAEQRRAAVRALLDESPSSSPNAGLPGLGFSLGKIQRAPPREYPSTQFGEPRALGQRSSGRCLESQPHLVDLLGGAE